jgi:hypothetical protein
MRQSIALRVLALLGSLVLACGGGATSSPAPAPADAGAASNAAPSAPQQPEALGSGCTPITSSYNICTMISTCPGLQIDTNRFPECGFSVHGSALDPECLCYGSMCPMGTPQTCDDMQTLLSNVTIESVCAEYQAGHCQSEGSIGGVDTDCQLCKANCNGNQACIQNCGC